MIVLHRGNEVGVADGSNPPPHLPPPRPRRRHCALPPGLLRDATHATRQANLKCRYAAWPCWDDMDSEDSITGHAGGFGIGRRPPLDLGWYGRLSRFGRGP